MFLYDILMSTLQSLSLDFGQRKIIELSLWLSRGNHVDYKVDNNNFQIEFNNFLSILKLVYIQSLFYYLVLAIWMSIKWTSIWSLAPKQFDIKKNSKVFFYFKSVFLKFFYFFFNKNSLLKAFNIISKNLNFNINWTKLNNWIKVN